MILSTVSIRMSLRPQPALAPSPSVRLTKVKTRSNPDNFELLEPKDVHSMFDTKPTFEHIVTDLRETQDIKIIDNGTTMKEPSCKQHQSLSSIVYTLLRIKHFPPGIQFYIRAPRQLRLLMTETLASLRSPDVCMSARVHVERRRDHIEPVEKACEGGSP